MMLPMHRSRNTRAGFAWRAGYAGRAQCGGSSGRKTSRESSLTATNSGHLFAAAAFVVKNANRFRTPTSTSIHTPKSVQTSEKIITPNLQNQDKRTQECQFKFTNTDDSFLVDRVLNEEQAAAFNVCLAAAPVATDFLKADEKWIRLVKSLRTERGSIRMKKAKHSSRRYSCRSNDTIDTAAANAATTPTSTTAAAASSETTATTTKMSTISSTLKDKLDANIRSMWPDWSSNRLSLMNLNFSFRSTISSDTAALTETNSTNISEAVEVAVLAFGTFGVEADENRSHEEAWDIGASDEEEGADHEAAPAGMNEKCKTVSKKSTSNKDSRTMSDSFSRDDIYIRRTKSSDIEFFQKLKRRELNEDDIVVAICAKTLLPLFLCCIVVILIFVVEFTIWIVYLLFGFRGLLSDIGLWNGGINEM